MQNYYIIDHIPCAVYYIPVLIYFITGGLYLLIPFTHFTVCSLPSGIMCLFYESAFIFSLFCLLDDTCKWSHTVFVFLCLLSLSLIVQFSHSIVSDSLWPLDCSVPGFPVHHQLPELAQHMSIQLVMPFNHLILSCPPLLLPSIFPSIRVFANESVLCIRWLSMGVSASASVLPMNIQDWSPLG